MRTGDRAGRLVVLATFAAVRVAAWLTGTRYSLDLLGLQPQLLDLRALEAHPFRAVADLHTQPPLFNLVVGSVLRWSPIPTALTFQLAWLACGVVIVLGCHAIARRLGAGPGTAVVAGVVVAVNPYLLGYEHQPTYEYPVAAMLVATTWALGRYEDGGSLGAFTGVVGGATAVVLTRSLFHPLWLVAVLALVLALRRPAGPPRRFAAVVGVALVLVGAVVVASGVRFGSWGTSSFFGMNLQRAVTAPLPADVVAEAVDRGEVGPVAEVVPFSELDAYVEAGAADPGCEGSDPVLGRARRSSGFANFDARCYLPLYEQAGDTARWALRTDPGRYVRTRFDAGALYLGEGRPSSVRGGAADLLATLHDVPLLLVDHHLDMSGWVTPVAGLPAIDSRASLTMGVAVLVAVGVGAAAALRRRRGTARSGDLVRLVLGFQVAYVTAVGVTLELGENGRFRALLDPLLLTVLVVAVGGRVASASPGGARAAG